ncbi:peptidoglycan-associated lipoprotein Pal [Oceanicoccus sp. KOV_DT_Chl]|uniref:peptidoglycan-associated lipoprotein Pal n=1 Tax=Oceanicoccus sp. KOV_DT_Chl TaxID=1904639 RepID=UPI000C798354|nr:peptidoglycan-associated lipoprotein Pal [Oceanicoccus sp. KOV_DT_Chl]
MDIKKTQLLSAIFASIILVGCASNSTDDSAAEAAAAEAAAAEQAAAEAAAAKAAAERAAAEAAANLETVFYFEFDQATLSAATRAALDAHVVILKNSTAKVRLEGHADERGTREYNMALGERRANAVANYLIINGVDRYRVETVSYGEERPMANGSDAASWSKNRRVELK